MSYKIRLMRPEDIVQVAEIDRQAFPSMWPTNYQREIQNQLAHYIVAYNDEKPVEEPVPQYPEERNSTGLVSRVMRLFGRQPSAQMTTTLKQYIVGFAGFWIMADEAHIISIAVQESHRGLGLGELLLVSSIDLALELKARLVTLEVRVSNITAQRLYQKYGFVVVGLRRGYYHDDDKREDAILMTLDNITSPECRTRLSQLKQDYVKRWGVSLPSLSE